jgi:hypothetical protein
VPASGEIKVDFQPLGAASNWLFVTTHGGLIPSAIRNKSVSRRRYLLRSGVAASQLGAGALPPDPRDI